MPAVNGNVPGALLNGEIYVVGGGVNPAAHYAYNPATDTWRTIAPPLTTTCQSGAAFASGGEVWMVGCLGLPLAQQVQVYNPTSDSWRVGPLYNQDHQSPGADLFLGRPFVVGGGAASGGSTAVESLATVACNSPTSTSTVTRTTTATPSNTITATPVGSTATNTPTSTSTVCAVPTFSDVHPTDYFYTAVNWLYCQGAITGYSDGTFRPYANTTRGQLTKIIVIARHWPIDLTGAPHFTDVDSSNVFYPFIETAYNRHIVSGYADGTFRPFANVTRGQLSKIIVQAMGWDIDTTGGPHFSDVPTTNPFYDFIETAYHHGVIAGYSDGTFRWANDATRGQISVIVYRAAGP
jgi:hypothetical protein